MRNYYSSIVAATVITGTTLGFVSSFAPPSISLGSTAPATNNADLSRFEPTIGTAGSISSTRLCMNKNKKGARKSGQGFGAFKLPDFGFKYAGGITPGKQSPQKIVTQEGVVKPDYALDGVPKSGSRAPLPWVIEVKTPQEIAKMRVAGRVAREVLDLAGQQVRPGITTEEIDCIVHAASLERGGYPSPLNYRGFPKSCCTSVNEVICHGIPDDRKLEEGDIINIDITCYVDGYHGDCSEMFVVGEPDDRARDLLQTTYDCWVKSLEFVKPGNQYRDIGGIIEDYITERGFSTVRNFCGHGIGSVFHTNPSILHYHNSEPNGQMAPGHTFTIEPMICEGSPKPLTWPDKWTATTADGGRSAQFEHTLLITPDGVEALTGKIESSPLQFWEKESKVRPGKWLGTTKAARARAKELNSSISS